jgi:polyhydroxybutyrate depolymerase
MATWQGHAGCGDATHVYFEQGDATCTAYDDCVSGTDVVSCMVDEGGHSWPGGAPSANVANCPADGEQSTTFFASEAIWRFFSQHPRVP